MKKIIALFLALTMVLGLAACGQKEPEEEPTTDEHPGMRLPEGLSNSQISH